MQPLPTTSHGVPASQGAATPLSPRMAAEGALPGAASHLPSDAQSFDAVFDMENTLDLSQQDSPPDTQTAPPEDTTDDPVAVDNGRPKVAGTDQPEQPQTGADMPDADRVPTTGPDGRPIAPVAEPVMPPAATPVAPRAPVADAEEDATPQPTATPAEPAPRRTGDAPTPRADMPTPDTPQAQPRELPTSDVPYRPDPPATPRQSPPQNMYPDGREAAAPAPQPRATPADQPMPDRPTEGPSPRETPPMAGPTAPGTPPVRDTDSPNASPLPQQEETAAATDPRLPAAAPQDPVQRQAFADLPVTPAAAVGAPIRAASQSSVQTPATGLPPLGSSSQTTTPLADKPVAAPASAMVAKPSGPAAPITASVIPQTSAPGTDQPTAPRTRPPVATSRAETMPNTPHAASAHPVVPQSTSMQPPLVQHPLQQSAHPQAAPLGMPQSPKTAEPAIRVARLDPATPKVTSGPTFGTALQSAPTGAAMAFLSTRATPALTRVDAPPTPPAPTLSGAAPILPNAPAPTTAASPPNTVAAPPLMPAVAPAATPLIRDTHLLETSDLRLSELGAAPARADPFNSAPLPTATTARADLPQQVIRQLADALPNVTNRPVEITLSPEELGRVRLSLTISEASVTVNLLADRPETLELLRRHIDLLGQEFKGLGFDTIAFAFGDDADGAPNDDTRDDADPALHLTLDPTEESARIAAQTAPQSGLDLRL